MLYPINLDLKGQPCLVVGGGEVAVRKAKSLLQCGAKVTIVAPSLHSSLKRIRTQKALHWIGRSFRVGDLKHQFLVIAATDHRPLNREISRLARSRRILVNAVDQPADCLFTVPSVMRRGSLTIAISTNGTSPALSRQIRLDLSRRYGPEVGRFLREMADVRKEILQKIPSVRLRKRFFEKRVKAFFQKRKRWGD